MIHGGQFMQSASGQRARRGQREGRQVRDHRVVHDLTGDRALFLGADHGLPQQVCSRLHLQRRRAGRRRQSSCPACLHHPPQQHPAGSLRYFHGPLYKITRTSPKRVEFTFIFGLLVDVAVLFFYGVIFTKRNAGVAVGSGWQSMVAYVNIGCYYLIGIPMGILLGWFFNLGVLVPTSLPGLTTTNPTSSINYFGG
jgi:hypothetical protein